MKTIGMITRQITRRMMLMVSFVDFISMLRLFASSVWYKNLLKPLEVLLLLSSTTTEEVEKVVSTAFGAGGCSYS